MTTPTITLPEPARRPAATHLTPYQQLALLCLYQHRLLTTTQIHQLLLEAGGNRREARSQLAALHTAGCADRVTTPGRAGQFAWFTTPLGAELAEAGGQVPARPYRITAQLAAGPLQQHLLTVNTVGLAFVRHARRLGEGYECGPLDFLPEVAHRLSDKSGGPAVIADALVRCVVPRERTRLLARAFIELDRGTMSVERLAAKLAAYGRYHAYRPAGAGRSVAEARPAWQHLYPAYPKIMIVLARPAGRALSLPARLQDLGMLVTHAAETGRLPAALSVTACTFDDLVDAGPYAPIHTDLTTGETDVNPFAAHHPRSARQADRAPTGAT